MPNFKLDISYDGSNFHGWQIQKNRRTVQGDITNALKKILSIKTCNLIGSGRTDSGVHANHQIGSIKLETTMSPLDVKNAINANTKKDIFINSCILVNDKFNARFSALNREYIYVIKKVYSPTERGYTWTMNYKINTDLLVKCAKYIIGENDFSAFCKESSLKENNFCKVYISKWTINEDKISYHINANRFLHHMVRFLVGTMIEVARGRISFKEFQSLLKNKKFNHIIIKAPPQGLFLNKVMYD